MTLTDAELRRLCERLDKAIDVALDDYYGVPETCPKTRGLGRMLTLDTLYDTLASLRKLLDENAELTRDSIAMQGQLDDMYAAVGAVAARLGVPLSKATYSELRGSTTPGLLLDEMCEKVERRIAELRAESERCGCANPTEPSGQYDPAKLSELLAVCDAGLQEGPWQVGWACQKPSNAIVCRGGVIAKMEIFDDWEEEAECMVAAREHFRTLVLELQRVTAENERLREGAEIDRCVILDLHQQRFAMERDIARLTSERDAARADAGRGTTTADHRRPAPERDERPGGA